MASVLVTGGLGYIGSHTVTCLIEAGHDVVIIDNLSNSDISMLGRLENLTGEKLTFHQTEMCDKNALDEVFLKHPELSGVIHFAALLLVNESVEKPTEYYYNNLVSTLNLIDCCSRHKVKNIVFSSSCTVYGQPDSVPVNELAPIKKAESPYGSTKIMCEQIFQDAVATGDIRVMCLRYFNPIGAHQSTLIGEFQHGEPHHLVPYITETAIGKRKMLRVFGGDYETRDGSCVRDYIHVMDIAEAHVLALDALMSGKTADFEAVNLGSGEGQTVLEMIYAFKEATGITIPFEIAERRPGDVEKVYADITKATSLLNWKPKRNLEEMLRSAWNWEQSLNHNV
ncbi:MAG: UDP-glucose 4-epimerase GalE [Bacteroidetes bacterium]|nr:UDP-glucose 4-epimerase GalE [Bacteroidota bacterium]